MSKKTKAKPPVEVVDGLAEHNARCVEAMKTIEVYTRAYRKSGESVTVCVIRLLAEVQQFRADDMHDQYMEFLDKSQESKNGGAK